jgi:hypothetical protein
MATLLATACTEPVERPPCADLDPALASSSFIVVRSPAPGERVTSPVRIAGCSRTYESNVVWELRGRDGRMLDSGFTTGGGVDGPAPFATSASFQVTAAEVGELQVYMLDESEGEGFPPPRAVFQVVLAP